MRSKKLRYLFFTALLVSLLAQNPAGMRAEELVLTAGAEGLAVETVRSGPQSNLSPGGRMTPGDSRTVELVVKNTRQEALALTVEARDLSAQSGPSLLDGLWVEVCVGGAVLGGFSARDGSYTFPEPLPPGAERRVALKVSLPCEAGNEFQQMSLWLQWVFTAQAVSPPPLPGGGGSADSGGQAPPTEGTTALIRLEEAAIPLSELPVMPKTGESPLWPTLTAGVLLIGCGLFLLAKKTTDMTAANNRGSNPRLFEIKSKQ